MIKEKSFNRLTPDATLQQLISADPHAADLLASIGLNPNQYENQTLRSVCQQRQWNEEELLKWIKKNRGQQACGESTVNDPDFGDDLNLWSMYLTKTLQPCITDLLADIERDFPRVHLVHGNQYPGLKNMARHFTELDKTLKRYFSFENRTLIPLSAKLNIRKETVLDGFVRNLTRSVNILESDRSKILDLMDSIRNQSEDFKNPEGACTTMRILNKNFTDLFKQLEKYYSLEQQRLFPLIKERIKSM